MKSACKNLRQTCGFTHTFTHSPRHFDRNTWSASGMYEVEKSVWYAGFFNIEIPPLCILRWRSVCSGRNDGGRKVWYE